MSELQYFFADPPYEASTDLMWCAEVASIAEWCPPESKGLDVGAGGRTLYPSVSRCDISPETEPEIVCDALRIPVGNDEYDWAFSGHCIEHFEKPQDAIREWCRVVKPGGHVCIVVPDVRYTLTQNTDATPHFHEWAPREFCIDVLGWEPKSAQLWQDCRKTLSFAPGKVIWASEACAGWSFCCVIEVI